MPEERYPGKDRTNVAYVEVMWDDPNTNFEGPEPYIQYTVGYLVEDNDERLVLVSSWNADEGFWGEWTTIPSQCVLNVKGVL